MSLKYKILVPLVAAFLAAVLITGWISVESSADAVEGSFRREMVTSRGFLTRMRPPLSPESLARMKRVFEMDLAVAEGGKRLHSTTLEGPEAAAFERALVAGKLEEARAGEGEALVGVRLGARGYRVLGGQLEGPPGAGGEPYAIYLLLDEGRIERAKARAVSNVLVAAGVGIVLVLLGGVFVARSFTRRLSRLSEAASRIAAGEETGRVVAAGGDELSRFAGAFNRMVDALAESRDRLVHSERMAALGKLASAIAHEIRNPLSSIRMTAEILKDEVPESGDREALQLLLNESRRLELFLEEILSLSGGVEIRPADHDVFEVAEETLTLLRSRLDHLGIEASLEIEAGTRHRLDADRVKQVLMNLLLNGAQFAGPGGKVRVRASRDGDGGLALEVLDSGPGVPDEARDRLFEPFFTTRSGGTGLGLAVSRRIAEAHGGKIEYRREEGWTVFAFVLPKGESEERKGG